MKAQYDMTHAKRGQIVPTRGKTRITIYVDDDILAHYRHEAEKATKGYQTLINEVLRESMENKRIDSVSMLRRVIREELQKVIDQ